MTPRNTNPGDYVRLDTRSSTPNVTAPENSTDNGVQPGGASIVQMQEEGWRLRAEAAQWAAEELTKIRQTVGQVLVTNYFGEGCPEGTAVYHALKAAFAGESGWEGELFSQASSLATLASNCRSAAAALTTSDHENSDSMRIV